MAKWRSIALEQFPELQKQIAGKETIMQFWIELWNEFQSAYSRKDESLIRRIYSFADWCLAAPRNDDPGHDPSTAVIVCFYEHIPDFPPAREDMPRWFRHEEVARDERTFAYFIGHEKYRELLQYIDQNQHHYEDRKSRSHG